MLEQFSIIVKRALQGFVSDHVNKRLKSALQGASDHATGENNPDDADLGESDDGIVTTEDEMEGFYVVKSIARQCVDPSRVYMRDTQSYCGVLLDDNNRKPICRMYFNTGQKYLGVFDQDKNVTRHKIDDINDIYQYADSIIATVGRYIAE